jgi:hypothetical protein
MFLLMTKIRQGFGSDEILLMLHIAYLKAVVEGQEEITPWVRWFGDNDEALQGLLTRTEYLRLKNDRIKAIPAILHRFDVEFLPSSRYEWLGGIPGHCRDCGSHTVQKGKHGVGLIYCPNGCFQLHGSPSLKHNVNSE